MNRADRRCRNLAPLVCVGLLLGILGLQGGVGAAATQGSSARSPRGAGVFGDTLSAGAFHACGLRLDGTATCWGANSYGQATPPAGAFTTITAGSTHTCGLRTNGTATCWGNSHYGQDTPPAGTFTALSAGFAHTCGIRPDRTVTCWGHESQVDAPSGSYTAVASGYTLSCGLLEDATARCWPQAQGLTPPPEGSFTAVTAGGSYACGLRPDATATCWGPDNHGEATPPDGTFTALAAGFEHTCGLRPGGTATCWGENYYGEAIAPGDTFTSLDVGNEYSCGLRLDGTANCWGNNDDGQSTAPAGVLARPGDPLPPTCNGFDAFGPFTDVAPATAFCADIEWLVNEGITTGYLDGRFRPRGSVTRQAMAAFLYRAEGEPPFTPPPVPTFPDVPADAPFFAEIEWLANEGITTGYPDDTYRPDDTVTRQAMAAFLYRAEGEPPFSPPGSRTFTDVPPTHPFYAEIEWLAAEGITTGYPDDTYRPDDTVTRQAMAAFLHRTGVL